MTALRASVTAGVVLAMFASRARGSSRLLGIGLGAFKIAGGVVLLLLALDMIRTQPSRTRITEGEVEAGAGKEDIAIVPLAMPLLAGPGGIATAIVLMARARGRPVVARPPGARRHRAHRGGELRHPRRRHAHRAGPRPTGLAILERAAGLLLVAIAVQFMLDGLGERCHGWLGRCRAAGGGRLGPRLAPPCGLCTLGAFPSDGGRMSSTELPPRPRLPRDAPRGLRDRVPRVPLARARPLQLGARLVRHPRRREPPHRAPHRREYGAEVRLSYAELAERSNRVATYLRRHGVGRGDRILMMLPNCVQIWEVMLAAMKLGACVIPATTLLTAEDLRDRIERGGGPRGDRPGRRREAARGPGEFSRHVVGELVPGWMPFEAAYDEASLFMPHGETLSSDPCSSTSQRHDREAEARGATTGATRWATSRRCTGSACARATCT